MNAQEHNALKAQYDAGIEDAVLGRPFGTSSVTAAAGHVRVQADNALDHWYGDGWHEGLQRKAAARRQERIQQLRDDAPRAR